MSSKLQRAADADPDFEVYTVEKVTVSEDVDEQGRPSYGISTTDHTGFNLSGSHGVIPQVGDTVKMWTRNASLIRGLQFNDRVAFYQTEKEDRRQAKRDQKAKDANERAAWAADKGGEKSDFYARVEALPEVFQRRMAKFLSTNPDFGWKFGGYELMVCEDAVKIGHWFRENNMELVDFKQVDVRMKEIGMSEDHSGNSFGFAVRLAAHWLREAELVVLEHGALTPLVGCEDYGCPHPS